MSKFTEDERDWLQRFQHHLNENVFPLLTKREDRLSDRKSLPSAITVQAEHVLKLLMTSSSHTSVLQHSYATKIRVPVEYDILSVEFLKTKFTTSFRAENPLSLTSNQRNEPATPTMGESRNCIGQCGVSKLHEVPVVLVGCLKSASDASVGGRSGGLMLQDLTGEIDCEVCHQSLPSHVCIDKIVVLLKWNYIHSNSSIYKSYLEIQELVFVDVGTGICSPTSQLPQSNVYSVTSLREHMSRNMLPKKAMLSVYGKVTAVSEVSKGQYFFVKINDDTNDPHFQHNIIVENCSLFYLSQLIKIHGVYLFINLQDKLIKGLAKEERVLASTEDTGILSYPVQCGNHCQSPPRKRTKTDDASVLSSSVQRCNLMDTEKIDSDQSLVQKKPPLQDPPISYRGVITKCILPEAGLYELDGRVRLYLTRRECTNRCRGLRNGATLELHNVHLLKISLPELKHASGFCCCALSTVQVVQFSTLDTPLKAFVARNKLASLAKKYSFMDMAWILKTYLSLVKNDANHDLKSRFALLEELCKMAAPCPMKQDILTELLSTPHHCKAMESDNLSTRHMISSVGHFLEGIDKRVCVSDSKEFQWYGYNQEDSTSNAAEANSPFVVFAVSAQWSFGIVNSSEILQKSVLVGTLRANEKTGYMELVDSTGSIPLICSIPVSSSPLSFQSAQSAQNLLLGGLGCKVLVTKSSVFVERSIEGHAQPQTTNLLSYLFIKEYKIFPVVKNSYKDSADVKCTGTCVTEEDKQCLYFKVMNKNGVFSSPLFGNSASLMQTCSSFAVQALVHTDVNLLRGSLCTNHDHVSDNSEHNQRDYLKRPLQVALNFPLKFYSFINNGCLYSLSLKPVTSAAQTTDCSLKLPTLKTLDKEPYLDITNNFNVQFLSFPLSAEKTPLDVTDLISKVFLLKFSTSSSPTKESRFDGEFVTLRGVILKHAYRIDHIATLTGSVASLTTASVPSRIIALTVQSLDHPDTIMVYCDFRGDISLPLGLLPGATVTFNSFKLKSSRSGNVYCTSTAMSNIVVNCLDGVEAVSNTTINTDSSVVTQKMLNLPTTHLSSMIERLLLGNLSGRIVCIVGKFMHVIRLSIQYKCLGCQSTVIDGSCMTACLTRRHVLRSEGRLIVEDGSGEGHVYINDDVLREAVGVSRIEWGELCDIVGHIGHVVYSGRSSIDKLQEDETTNRFSLVKKAKNKISGFVSQPNFHRTVKLFCQPFVSQAELKEYVIGQKCHIMMQYNTLALPRLQLRAVALLDMNKSHLITTECEQLLKLLNCSS